MAAEFLRRCYATILAKDPEEGVFRLSPEETAFKKLKKEYDKTHSVRKLEFLDPVTAAALAKYALRVYPGRLIPSGVRDELCLELKTA